MIAFAGTALLCLGLAVHSAFSWDQDGARLVLAACLIYMAATFGLTMLLNQPMNLRLGDMRSKDALAYWPRYLQSWTMWNHVRTAAALSASALFIAALVQQAVRSSSQA